MTKSQSEIPFADYRRVSASDASVSFAATSSTILSKHKPFRRAFWRYGVFFALFLACAAAGTYFGLQTAIASIGPLPLKQASHLIAQVPRPSNTEGADAASRKASRPIVNPENVDPLYLKMLLAFEDRRFYSHFGVDPIALMRAAAELASTGKIITGGSP